MAADTKQIDYPRGMVSHVRERRPDMPGGALVTLYPDEMALDGCIYVRAEHAGAIKVGDPIQIDRIHTRVTGIGPVETVEDVSKWKPVKVRARAIYLDVHRDGGARVI